MKIEILIHPRKDQQQKQRAVVAEPQRGPVTVRRDIDDLGRRRNLAGYINFYDLAYYTEGGDFLTVPLSSGGPLVQETAPWSDLIEAYNFPLSLPPSEWKDTFKKMGREYVISAHIFTNESGLVEENIEFTDEKGYKLPSFSGQLLSANFTNSWLSEPDSIHTYYETGLFDQFGLVPSFSDYFTEEPDPESPQVTPDIDFKRAINLFMPPAAIRVTGEYYPDAPPDGGGGGSGSSPWRLLPFPEYRAIGVEQTCEETEGLGGVVYYRTNGDFIEFSRLPNGGVQPPFKVCGLGGSANPDGTYPNLSPELFNYNTPTIFWDRTAVFENYLEGTIEEDDEDLRERMVAISRLQGGANIKRIGGVWSLADARDDLTYSRINVGGTGESEPFLYGAINQGSKWYFRWQSI